MAQCDKRIAAMRRNPKNVRPDELNTLLITAGFTVRQQGSSHRVYSYGPYVLPVPQRKPFLLPIYVKQALVLLDSLAASQAVVSDGNTNGSDADMPEED